MQCCFSVSDPGIDTHHCPASLEWWHALGWCASEVLTEASLYGRISFLYPRHKTFLSRDQTHRIDSVIEMMLLAGDGTQHVWISVASMAEGVLTVFIWRPIEELAAFYPEKDRFGVGEESWDWRWRDELVLVQASRPNSGQWQVKVEKQRWQEGLSSGRGMGTRRPRAEVEGSGLNVGCRGWRYYTNN